MWIIRFIITVKEIKIWKCMSNGLLNIKWVIHLHINWNYFQNWRGYPEFSQTEFVAQTYQRHEILIWFLFCFNISLFLKYICFVAISLIMYGVAEKNSCYFRNSKNLQFIPCVLANINGAIMKQQYPLTAFFLLLNSFLQKYIKISM